MTTRHIRIRGRGRPRSRVARRSIVVVWLQCVLIAGVFPSVATANTGSTVALANDAGTNLVVWVDRGVKGAFVDQSAGVGSTFEISTRYALTSTPATATDGTSHLVVWQEFSDVGCYRSAIDLFGAIVASDGTVSEPFSIAAFDGPCDVSGYFPSPDALVSPRVDFDGTNYFVVWEALHLVGGIEGARVTPDGAVLDPGGVTLVPAPESGYYARPRLAFDGTNFLIVYYRAAGELCYCTRGLYATRVNTLAAPIALDPHGIPISTAYGGAGADMDFGGVAYDGFNWVVLWTQKFYRPEIPVTTGLVAARVSSQGILLDPLGVKVATTSRYDDPDGPSVVFNGTNLLVIWGPEYDPDAKAMILKSDLTTGFEVVRPPFSVPLENPDAAMSVGGFLVVGLWEKWPSPDVRGLRIESSGDLTDSEPFAISSPDTSPPETTISSSPPALSNSATATFELDANESAGFECSLDGEAFTPCSSPMTYTNLAEAAHTFEVFARDRANNVDATPAVWSWTIDTTAPDTNVITGPPALTNQGTASFSFASNDREAGFECALDGSEFDACSSPLTYTALGDGSHTFEVAAIDDAGNADGTPASRTWAIDTTAPGSLVMLSPADASSTSNAKPTFDWNDAADVSGASYQIQIDNSGSAFSSAEIDQNGLNTSTFTPTTALSAGSYSWRVRAIDGAGNEGVWSSAFSITITTPPGTISGTVTSSATKKGIGGATVDCGSAGRATTAADGTFTIANVAPGSYSCIASATGHKSMTKSVTVKSNATVTANFALRKA